MGQNRNDMMQTNSTEVIVIWRGVNKEMRSPTGIQVPRNRFVGFSGRCSTQVEAWRGWTYTGTEDGGGQVRVSEERKENGKKESSDGGGAERVDK